MDHIKFQFGSDPIIDRLYLELITEDLAIEISPADLLSKFTCDPGRHIIHAFVENGRMVTTNTFIKLKFHLSDAELEGHQSCFTTTSRKHRGRGLWVKLMKLAESDLENSDAAFIFGFPNEISFPIFRNRLQYEFQTYRNYLLFPKIIKPRMVEHLNSCENSILASFEDLKSWKCSLPLQSSPWENANKENQIIADRKKLGFNNFKLKIKQILAVDAKSPLHAEQRLRKISSDWRIEPLYAMLPINYHPRLFHKVPASRSFPVIVKLPGKNSIIRPANQLFIFRGAMDVS
jgi:hypothetical protein